MTEQSTQIATITPESLSVITYNDTPVITTELLANIYGTDVNNIQQNFKRNSDRFIVGKHFFKLEGADLRAIKNRLTDGQSVPKHTRSLILWTVRGAARHAKMLDTDKAWDMFEKMEDCYFSQKEVAALPASRPEKTRKALPNGLTIEQQETIKKIVKDKADALPHDKRAKATITCWSALKAKFGVTYKEIAPEHFTDAVSLLSRITLEGEYIPAGVSTEKDNELSYSSGRAIIAEIRQLANAYLSGVELNIMMTECDKLERVLVSGFTEINESLMRIQSAAFMLSRWSKH